MEGVHLSSQRRSPTDALPEGLPELRAFPGPLAPDAATVIEALRGGEAKEPAGEFTVVVGNERLTIPYRVYYDPDRVRAAAERPGTQGTIALCLGSRHHDGRLRQWCVERLLAIDEPWIVPFVVQLVGEYVVQIVECIEQALPGLQAVAYGQFVTANPAYLAKLGARVASYWDAHYRGRYPQLRTYPGSLVLGELKRFASTGYSA